MEIESERRGGGEKVNPDYEMKYFRMIFLLIISLAAHTTCRVNPTVFISLSHL